MGYAPSPAGLWASSFATDVDSVKGLLQRAGQVAFGVWLVLLGWWASESGQDAGEPVGDGGGDRVAVP